MPGVGCSAAYSVDCVLTPGTTRHVTASCPIAMQSRVFNLDFGLGVLLDIDVYVCIGSVYTLMYVHLCVYVYIIIFMFEPTRLI